MSINDIMTDWIRFKLSWQTLIMVQIMSHYSILLMQQGVINYAFPIPQTLQDVISLAISTDKWRQWVTAPGLQCICVGFLDDVVAASIPYYDILRAMVQEYCGKVSVVNFSIVGWYVVAKMLKWHILMRRLQNWLESRVFPHFVINCLACATIMIRNMFYW